MNSKFEIIKKIQDIKYNTKQTPSYEVNTKLITIILSIISVVVLGLIAFLWWFGHGIGIKSLFSSTYDGNFTILLAGTDVQYHGQRTDTILLGFVFPDYQRIELISLPRDTRVNVSGHGYRKLNSAYSIGGIELLRKTIEENFNINIDHYAVINLDGFINIIDILGGVVIDIERDMHYDDVRGNLHIHLKKGRQLLNGEKAMQYVRYRDKILADLGRIKRQQKFLKAITDKLKNIDVLWKLPAILREVRNNIKTDLSYEDIMTLVKRFNYFRNSKLKMWTLPGKPNYINKISFFIPDMKKFNHLLERIKNLEVNLQQEERENMLRFLNELNGLKTQEINHVQNNKKEQKEQRSRGNSSPISR